jgi:Fe-S oxidoreductase
MRFDFFVVPFCLGFAYLIIVLLIKSGKWISELEAGAGIKILKSLFTGRTAMALKEFFIECLLHRKVFKVNRLLGYMHMSLAFGWFLLIVIGKFEATYYTGQLTNEFYYPIFFRYFENNPHPSLVLQTFNAIMDLLLLFILSGVVLAVFKRYNSNAMGMKNSTKHSPGDKWALAMLWMIFPLRLFAESLTAGCTGNGSFLTQTFGNVLVMLFPVRHLAYVAWWAYSVALGSFMFALPYSRYMHIPTEILLIFLKNWGLKPGETITGIVSIELYACSRCGICIDPCQMDPSRSRKDQMVYFLRKLRDGKPIDSEAHNCLLCGRCQDICPVGINLTNMRLIGRKQIDNLPIEPGSYPAIPIPVHSNACDVIYFSGCMGSLTPGVRLSMESILEESGVNYLFLDKEKSYCCGRPLKLAGRYEDAERVSQNIKEAILASGAHTLVTSCPICYKCFIEDYKCKLRILHHSEYLLELIQSGLISPKPDFKRIVYHDPCELGRKSGIYTQPRELLSRVGYLVPVGEEAEKSLCCGGSLGNLSMSVNEREKIQQATALYLNHDRPDCIATACPLCKKSLAKFSGKPVKDIAELVAENLLNNRMMQVKAKKSTLAAVETAVYCPI